LIKSGRNKTRQKGALPMRLSSKATGALAVLVAGLFLGASAVSAATITVATVNNGDMIIMQRLSPQWEKATGNKINWVVLEENVLRERVTTDIATKGGEFDVITIGAYETPIWGKLGWLAPLNGFDKSYDYADIFPSLRNGLSVKGMLYAAPFYAESSFTMYRSDLFK
jgi:sorbitol/mannitol transport system substrate-binding protein